MKRVCLFYLSEVKYGGWPTFTCHLAHALSTLGIAPVIVRIGKKTATKPRSFGRGLSCYLSSINDAVSWAKSTDSIVVVAAPKMANEAKLLVEAGARLVVHDPTELKGGHLDGPIATTPHNIVVIRKTMIPFIEDRGGKATHLPHPYVSTGYNTSNPNPTNRQHHAVAVSRVDFDKNTDIIAKANDLLPPERRVAIYGMLNRLYAHHKLDQEVPKWRNEYMGTFAGDSLWAGSLIAREGKYTVDMSMISGDGGGTQYTHLEAWDAGSTLILHKGWMTGNPERDEVGKASILVGDEHELVQALSRDADHTGLREEAARLLSAHDPKSIEPVLRGIINGCS